MLEPLLDLLVDPVDGGPLTLATGVLRGRDGRAYPVRDDIPRFVYTADEGQKQTEESFGYKWRQRDTYNSPGQRAVFRDWLVSRYGFADAGQMQAFFRGRKRILDAGCGGGFSASMWMEGCTGPLRWIGADISAAIDVARERLGHIPGTAFVQADLMQLPFRGRTFDTIFSEGVLHHTPSTEKALKALVPLMQPGGEIMFYVYRKKGPLREFADDHIREVVSCLPPEAAWEALRPLTRLGQALAELKTEVEVPEDIPYLGIKAGRHDVQRLVYWNFLKLFWNERFSFEENHHINFDWYHPRYAHRQTEEEVRHWCAEAGLAIRHCDVQESGITIRAVKQ